MKTLPRQFAPSLLIFGTRALCSTLKIGLRMALFGAADLPLFGLSLDLPGASSLVKDVSDVGSRLDQSI